MGKYPRHAHHPSTAKQAKTAEVADSRHVPLRWSFRRFDNHRWFDSSYTPVSFDIIAGYLKAYEGRTWGEIQANRERDHQVPIARLVTTARKTSSIISSVFLEITCLPSGA